MSAVMYKQRFNQPNYSSTPNKNAEHIRYIGTRPDVMKNEGQKHGLFGNIYNSNTLEVNTKINDVMELVRRKSYEKKNIFKAVISFSPENAACVTQLQGVPLLQQKLNGYVRIQE